ncbi:MAG: UTP--glucose-1-phosphate uridylyltransferase GalU [Firmicutes bacterium]|nr:UTP--glucose-1-phosphate uridylyltransferase GalU [Bacillota bacterium]
MTIGQHGKRVRKAVIPAAGLGTRFLPSTKAQPKEMLPIIDKPIIQYVVEEVVAAGIEDVIIVTGRSKRAIEDHFDRCIEVELALERSGKDDMLRTVRSIADLADIHYIRQKEPLGLGHAVLQAKHHVGDEPFVVLLGDEVFVADPPAIRQLMDAHSEAGGSIVAVQEVQPEDTSRYGIVDAVMGEGLPRVRRLVEKPGPQAAPSNLAVIGRYVLEAAIFDILEDLPPGKNGEIQLTDALDRLAREGGVHATTITGQRYDVGDAAGLIRATLEFALKRDDLREAVARTLREVAASINLH